MPKRPIHAQASHPLAAQLARVAGPRPLRHRSGSFLRASTACADSDPAHYGALLGRSAAMRRVFDTLYALENSLASVLIRGESGTGKELCARAIHDHSAVHDGAFVSVNCGLLDRTLARSELFGHERGAFTGAVERAAGCFREASGGTLFLDEIAELPLDVQPLLLRALETRTITPLGGRGEISVQVRLIAATHRDLEREVAMGRFREDLYYRIQVVSLKLPALRERPEDVTLIAQALAEAQGAGDLPAPVLERLSGYHWPGNVRELRNAVERFMAVGHLNLTGRTAASHLDEALRDFVDPAVPYAEQKQRLLDRFCREYLRSLLLKTSGNQTEAARLSGLDRSYLGKLVARLEVATRDLGTP